MVGRAGAIRKRRPPGRLAAIAFLQIPAFHNIECPEIFGILVAFDSRISLLVLGLFGSTAESASLGQKPESFGEGGEHSTSATK